VLLLAAVAHRGGAAAPIEPILPCDRTVYIFGGSTILAEGVRVPGSNDFTTRMRSFFERVCDGSVRFNVIAAGKAGLLEEVGRITSRLIREPKSIALIHFPSADIEKGASVHQLIGAYRQLSDACTQSGSICIIGGQQPVNSFGQAETDRQLEVERRATAEFGRHFLALYRYFESETKGRRLMVPFDSGDGRFIDDRGHGLLYEVYRRRLLELTGASR